MLKRIEDLYDRFGDKLYRYLCFRMKSADDAEDVLQEVFCRIMKHSWRMNIIQNPCAYLFRMARNEAFRRMKKNAAYEIGSRTKAIHEIINDIIVSPDRGELNKLADSLEIIREDQREIIYLKFFEDLTFKEIASACRISINTAASRYRYGMEKLRRKMEGQK